MGLASKRRAGSGGSSGAPGGTKTKNSTGRLKDKGYKGDDGREDGKGSRSSSSGRSRLSRRAGSTSPTPDSSRRRRSVDLSKLARGMSSRLVGARVSQQLTILSPDEIERDLRHMEAYGNACTAYSQQLFLFNNRKLVLSGHFGPVSAPGLTVADHYLTNGATDGYGYQGYSAGMDGGQYGGSVVQRQDSRGGNYTRDGRAAPGSQFAMPVRIDPEEEKRVAMLRKRIAASEAQREVLETEYIALRAHYVNESQKLLRTRDTVDGQQKMLQELIQKRGKVLAFKRVRCAVARDILSCLERRTQLLESQDGRSNSVPSSADSQKHTDDAQAMEGVVLTDKAGVERSAKNEKELADILDVWNSIEDQLREAEQACMNVEAPKLSESANKTQARQGKAAAKGSKEDSTMNGGKKRARRGSDESGEKDPAAKRSKDSASDKKEKDGEDDDIVPWESQIMPRTPYGVPVFLSYMSAVPDKAAAFACGGMFGSKKDTMCWLESNIPESFSNMASEREEMLRLREESEFLTQELEKERETNKELQRQIIGGRKRSDEMCAMMTMLRSETEAVLHRHNVLLYTPDARAAAQAIHSQAVEEREQRGEVYDDEEPEHAVEERVADEYEEAPVKGEHRTAHAMSPEEEGEIHEDDDVDDGDDQVSLAVTNQKSSSAIESQDVDRDSRHQLQEDDNVNDGDDEGEIDEDDDEEEGEIVEDERRKPPNDVYFGDEDTNHNDVWGRKEGLGGRTGNKRGFEDSEDGGDDMRAPSSPFGSGKRRRRV